MLNETRQELRRFAETTGIKGVGRIVKTSSKVIRFFWLISIVICFGLLLFQLYSVLYNYTSHAVTRSSKVLHTKPNFPDVTICNLFPVYNMSSASYNEYLKTIETMMQYIPEEQQTTGSRLLAVVKSIEFYNANTPLMEEFRENDGFVVECQQYGWDMYTPAPCTTTAVLTPPLQKCHQIELDRTNGTVAAVTVLLFTNNFQSEIIDGYNSWIRVSMGTGARVMIHPRGTLPNSKASIMVSAGNQLNIQLTQTTVNRLPKPYGDCTDRELLVPSQSDSQIYSTSACISLCRQRQMIKECKCLDNDEIFTDEEFNLVNGSFCANITEAVNGSELPVEAARRRLELILCQGTFVPDEDACDCPIPCSETYYDTSASSSQWPNPLYHLSFYKQFIRNNVLYGDKFSTYEDILKNSDNQSNEETVKQIKSLRLIEDNFLEVLLTFSDEKINVYADSATVTWDTLVANLGGSFNLWLGICVPTFAEIIELICSLLVIACGKRSRAKVIQVVPDKKSNFIWTGD